MGIGFVITMALFIKCFAAHTPSRYNSSHYLSEMKTIFVLTVFLSNPKLPKNKHIGETLRRPMHTLRRKVRPGVVGSDV